MNWYWNLQNKPGIEVQNLKTNETKVESKVWKFEIETQEVKVKLAWTESLIETENRKTLKLESKIKKLMKTKTKWKIKKPKIKNKKCTNQNWYCNWKCETKLKNEKIEFKLSLKLKTKMNEWKIQDS